MWIGDNLKLEICQKSEFLESFRITLASIPGGTKNPKSQNTKTPEYLPDLNPQNDYWHWAFGQLDESCCEDASPSDCTQPGGGDVVENLRLLRPRCGGNHLAETGSCGTGAGSQVKQSGKLSLLTGVLTCEPWSLKYSFGDFHVINWFVLDCIGACEGKLQLHKSLDELRRRRPRLLKIAIWRYPAWYTCGTALIHTAQSKACMLWTIYCYIYIYVSYIYIWYMWLAPTQLYENVDIFTPLMTHTHLITFLYKPGWTLLVARAHRSRCSSCVSCNVPLVRRLLSTWGEFPMSSCHWSGHQEDGNTKWNAGTISPKSELASQKEQFDSSTSSKLGVTWWFHFSVHFTIIHSYFKLGRQCYVFGCFFWLLRKSLRYMTDPRRKDMEVAAYSGWETVNLLVICWVIFEDLATFLNICFSCFWFMIFKLKALLAFF